MLKNFYWIKKLKFVKQFNKILKLYTKKQLETEMKIF